MTLGENTATMAREVTLDQSTVLYLYVKRPDSSSKWIGGRLQEFQTNQKVISKIEKHKDERMFVKASSKRDIVCSVMIDQVTKNPDGTFLVTCKEVRQDVLIMPGVIKSFAGGFAEGPPPITVPLN